jgi:hypothetical protein
MTGLRAWAIEELGHAQLGDIRRRDRLVLMAARAAEHPGGRLTEVFTTSAERQGAYDLLDNEAVTPSALTHAMGVAAARRCGELERVLVVIDGSSVTLTDKAGNKDFGAIGTFESGARGLKVISALAVGVDGVPLGVLDQQYWTRTERQVKASVTREVSEKETKHWINAINDSVERLQEESPATKACIVIDREGDNHHILKALDGSGADFIIRSSYNRRLVDAQGRREVDEGDRVYICGALEEVKAFEVYDIPIAGGSGRKPRQARMQLRAMPAKLCLRDKRKETLSPMDIWVVETKELDPPKGSEPIEWRLLTSIPTSTAESAHAIVEAYARRWRIEEFHKTWKSSLCDVESSLLRSTAHAQKWVSVLAAVAVRSERLKYLARTTPKSPAARELHPLELQALLLLKTQNRRRNERISMRMKPDIETVVRWIAELGGYTGSSSGGPPGTITICRGLERLRMATEVLAILHLQGKL